MARATKAPDPQPAPATVAEAIDRWNALTPAKRQAIRARCADGHPVAVDPDGTLFCPDCATILTPGGD